MKAIQTEKLTKFYGKHRGIVDVDLSVEQGDFYGFIGPNGAGKSTTIRTLLGLIAPTSGKAEILGLDMEKDRTEILSKVGYLPSETAFWRGMRVKEILEFSAKLRKLDCKQEAEILCQRLDLDPSRKVEQLSFGNRKKVGIVCALQHKPDLYILDEPTGGLDPLMQKEFYTILQERNTQGATVFLSSHVLSEVGHTGMKQVVLREAEALPEMAGLQDVKWEGKNVSFFYNGNVEDLIRTLGQTRFKDVNITDPDLEEVFLHYYGKEAL